MGQLNRSLFKNNLDYKIFVSPSFTTLNFMMFGKSLEEQKLKSYLNLWGVKQGSYSVGGASLMYKSAPEFNTFSFILFVYESP